MPKYAHQTFEGGGIAVWHITETAEQLYAMLGTHFYDRQLEGIRNESRRAEWLAVRVLVAELLGTECVVAYHQTGRPYLSDGNCHISISHTKGYAALAYCYDAPIGLDIEHVSPRVSRVAHRFLTSEEATYIDKCDERERLSYQLLGWSAKEALYKFFDIAEGADFQTAFNILPYALEMQGSFSVVVGFLSNTAILVNYQLFPDFVCTWVMGAQGILSGTDSFFLRRGMR